MNKIALRLCFLLQVAAYANEHPGYTDVILPPLVSLPTEGCQIMHTRRKNKPYTDSLQAKEFVQRYLADAVQLESDADAMRFASDHVELEGAYIELGVFLGRTINFLAALNPKKTIYGFDSFEGLPEEWTRTDAVLPKGTFAFKDPDSLPLVLRNVELYKGWFNDTLPIFAKEKLQHQPLALIHIDCDIYTSTAQALEILRPYIREGTVLIFDELYNYPGYEAHEWKALCEFLQTEGWRAEYLAYNVNHEQVVIKIRR